MTWRNQSSRDLRQQYIKLVLKCVIMSWVHNYSKNRRPQNCSYQRILLVLVSYDKTNLIFRFLRFLIPHDFLNSNSYKKVRIVVKTVTLCCPFLSSNYFGFMIQDNLVKWSISLILQSTFSLHWKKW